MTIVRYLYHNKLIFKVLTFVSICASRLKPRRVALSFRSFDHAYLRLFEGVDSLASNRKPRWSYKSCYFQFSIESILYRNLMQQIYNINIIYKMISNASLIMTICSACLIQTYDLLDFRWTLPHIVGNLVNLVRLAFFFRYHSSLPGSMALLSENKHNTLS